LQHINTIQYKNLTDLYPHNFNKLARRYQYGVGRADTQE
jgi:hypothetical protein